MTSSASSATFSAVPSPAPFLLPPGLDLTRLRREATRELARRDLFAFSQYTAPADDYWGWHHRLLYRYLHAFAVGTIKRLIVEMPPRHGKSEGTSRRLPAWLIGRMPYLDMLLCSHTVDLAKEMFRDVRHIVESDRFGELFPRAGLGRNRRDRDRADLFDVAGGGTLKAAGVGTGISGRGYARGIIDDYFKDREQANSAAEREHVWRWYTSTFHTRQGKDAGILITATRWHEDDLVGRLKRKMAAGESEPFEVLTLPALATDRRHPDDPRQPGEALWPAFRDEAFFDQRRRLEPRDFYALDQQDPRAEGGTEWPADLFGPSLWFDNWPTDEIEAWVVACDPSKGRSSKHGDYSALVLLARDRSGHYWIEADLARRPADRIVADTYELVRRGRAELVRTEEGVGYETDGFAALFLPILRTAEKQYQLQLRLHDISHGGAPKATRIRRLTPRLTAGKLHFRSTPGTRLLVRQMEEFPLADHDDGPDALEMADRLIERLWPWSQARPRR